MESITVKEGVHPWTMTKHAVPVITNKLEFLCTKVDDPGSHFQALKEFIEEFKFPKLVVKTPITLLWKIIAECIVSCCRALLSLQPVKQDQAIKLDHLIASKVHEALSFSYRAMTSILTLPLSLHGMGFPSIEQINAGLSIDRPNCDLKHHIPVYHNIARLTLADWTCSINSCTYPLDGKGLNQNFTHYCKCIPTAWIIVQQYMGSNELRLALRHTDISYISSGDIAISHVLNLAKGQSIAVPDGHAMQSITSKGIRLLKDVKQWVLLNGRIEFEPHKPPTNTLGKKWTNRGKENWDHLMGAPRLINTNILYSGEFSLLIARSKRESDLENYIHNLPTFSRLLPSQLLHNRCTWASDGSMVPASAGLDQNRSVTEAPTGPKTVVIHLNRHSLSIMHGEHIGMIWSLLTGVRYSCHDQTMSDTGPTYRLLRCTLIHHPLQQAQGSINLSTS